MLDFARDRPTENFLWTVGFIFEPQFSNCWRILAKVNSLLTTIDDVYDVYGTLDELQLFTDAIVSGQVYVNHIYWRLSGTTVDTRQLFKNTWIMHGFQFQDQQF